MSEVAAVQTRVEWVDVAKGLGILFVIVIHAVIPTVNAITIHLSSFTIPLFFFITGLTYNNERHRNDLSQYIKKRGQQLMVPYFLLYVLMVLLFIPLAGYIDTYLTPDQLLFWMLYGAGPPDASTHLWFLQVLFFGLVIFVVTDAGLAGRHNLWKALSFLLFVFGALALDTLFGDILVPWRLSSALLAVGFIWVGNSARTTMQGRDWQIPVRASALGIVLLLCSLIPLSTLNGFTDLAVDNYGLNIGLYIINGVLGSVLVILLASLFSRAPLIGNALVPIGTHSQEAYEIHPLPLLLAPLLLGLFFGSTVSEPVFWCARFLLSAVISIPTAVYLVRRSRVARLLFLGSTAA
jgi:acyltransferase